MITPTEEMEQVALVNWLKLNNYLFHANPNGGKRNAKEAFNLKRGGVVAGVSDLTIFLKHKILYLELKRQKVKLKSGKMSASNSKTSSEQLDFICTVKKYDYALSTIAFGYADAIEQIKELDK
jgi:hypothetical protein